MSIVLQSPPNCSRPIKTCQLNHIVEASVLQFGIWPNITVTLVLSVNLNSHYRFDLLKKWILFLWRNMMLNNQCFMAESDKQSIGPMELLILQDRQLCHIEVFGEPYG